MLFGSVERLLPPPVPRQGEAGPAAVRWEGPRPGPLPKIRSRERARGRGLVCFARRRPGIGVRSCAPLGPRLRAQRLEGLAGAAEVLHWEEKVTRGRDRESRGRGLTIPVARQWTVCQGSPCPGAVLFQAAMSPGPWMRVAS